MPSPLHVVTIMAVCLLFRHLRVLWLNTSVPLAELIPGLAACVAAKQASCLKAQYAEMLTKLSLSTFCECKLKGTDDTSWKKAYESCGKTKSEKCIVDKSTASASCRNQIVQDRIKDYKFMAASAKDRGGTCLLH